MFLEASIFGPYHVHGPERSGRDHVVGYFFVYINIVVAFYQHMWPDSQQIPVCGSGHFYCKFTFRLPGSRNRDWVGFGRRMFSCQTDPAASVLFRTQSGIVIESDFINRTSKLFEPSHDNWLGPSSSVPYAGQEIIEIKLYIVRFHFNWTSELFESSHDNRLGPSSATSR